MNGEEVEPEDENLVVVTIDGDTEVELTFKEKTYKIVARTVNADGAYEGGDIVLQVVKLYPENKAPKIRPVDIEVSPASGDIAAAVTEAKATVPVVGNIMGYGSKDA